MTEYHLQLPVYDDEGNATKFTGHIPVDALWFDVNGEPAEMAIYGQVVEMYLADGVPWRPALGR
jgi:hypothetical protein